MRRRRVCFVTGTRAEFGLMRSTLAAIRAHAKLQLQIIVTGMHLDPSRGRTVGRVGAEWFRIDRIVEWPTAKNPHDLSRQTGLAMSRLAEALAEVRSQIILVVGDRVEAFAAAAAGHIAGCVVAHVHGGDRALGQVDDSLRHAITKLAHIHFPATPQSAKRIARLGEDRWRIHCVGSPGLSQIAANGRKPAAACEALIVLHPADSDARVEYQRACGVLRAVESFDFDRIHIVYPNTDPGADGIMRCWRGSARNGRIAIYPDLPRHDFLKLLRNAAVLVGNSSSGIIEAASFGTPVIDIGPRQFGRERSKNVTNVPYGEAHIRAALKKIWNNGRPRRFRGRNVYAPRHRGIERRIADILATVPLDDRIRRKLIAY